MISHTQLSYDKRRLRVEEKVDVVQTGQRRAEQVHDVPRRGHFGWSLSNSRREEGGKMAMIPSLLRFGHGEEEHLSNVG
jgi:hypothetical protein